MTDLDTPKAIMRLRAIEKDLTIGAQDKRALFLYADQVLALNLHSAPREKLITAEAQLLIDQRSAARAAGNWSESDRLRDELLALGVEVQDKKS
jgi:cysteinyl-tRNA synthetase